MGKYQYDMVVIGGGAAGLTASTACGSVGAKTLLIEKDDKLGGDCLHYGCVPSKSLIKTAYARHVMMRANKYGLPGVDVPPVDFKQVAARIKGIIDTIQVHDSPAYIKEKFKVETKFGLAKFLDNHTIELDGKRISAKNFVLAMGSSPAIPPIDGISDVPYITNMNIFSLDKLPESMIVLGGGPIGMEMAQAFHRLGTEVTVVQSSSHVLAREDEDISEYVEEILMEEGLKMVLGAKAVKVKHQDDTFYLTIEKDGQQSELSARVLLVAAGRTPNINGLELKTAGVEYDRRGIKVDRRLRTASKNIYACGDINGRYPFTHVAAYESGVAMMNAIFKLPLKVDYRNVPWCTYLDPEVASVGYNEKMASEAGVPFTIQKELLKDNHRALAESSARGFIKVLVNGKGVPIGCQIVGPHAGELIHEWVAIIAGKVSLNTIGNAIHAYPTLAEINKTASFNYFINASVWMKLRLLLNWRW